MWAEMLPRTTAWLLDTSERILQGDSLQQITAFYKMKSFHRYTIRNVFDKALNTVADVLPNTPRIEVAPWTIPARA